TANNGILGGWATVAGTDFAGYVASGAARGGVGALGTAGFPAYSTAALSAGSATDNITVAASVTVPASTPVAGLGRTINSLRVSAASTITITTGEILTLGTGGLLLNGAASSITGGSLSAGASANTAAELFAYTNNTATISSVIANNGTGALTLVKNGPSSLTLSSNNTFTGGTIVNSGTLILGGNAGVTTVPAGSGAGATVGLTINNASVTMGTNSGQIAAATNININGAGLLTYTGNNTLSGILNFNNSGGFNGTAVATPAALTNSTTVNTSNLVTVTSTVGLAVGQVVTGANIPGGATIISILSPTQFLLSANATGGATNTTITLVNNAPTLIASSTAAGTLTITGAVNSNNDNLASVPTIAGPISLGNGNRTITTTGTSPQGLIISGVVSGAGATNVITKMGTSGLTLGGASTFGILGSTSVNLNQGSLIYTADSAPSVVGTTTLTTSPLGLGTLLVSGDGTKLMGAGPTPIGTTTLRTLANPISITNPSNTLTFGASLLNTTMNGVITFAGSTGIVDVESPNNIITFGASLPAATTSFTKKGLGRLDLLLANNFNTAVNITDGTLSIGNQYSLGGSSLAPGPAVTMAGGAYNLTATLANTFVQNPVSLTANAIISAQVGTAAVGPVTLASTATALGVQGANANNIIGALTLNGSTQTTLFTATSSDLRVYGGLAGTTPSLRKTGPATLSLGGGSSYTGPVTVEQGILESLVGNANAITSGAATVNPGAVLRLAAPNNVGGTITLNTDSFGIAILGLGYNGALPAGVSFGVGGGTIAVDAFGFATALTTPMAGTNLYLGSSSTGNYIASSLGVGVGGAYRLGTGGGTLNMNTQVLTGAGNSVTIGSVTGTPGANLVGSGGTVVLNTPNSYGGGTTINGNGVAQIGMAGAFGNGTIHFNGGTLQPNSTGISTLLAPFDVTNNIDFTSSVVGAAGNASGAYAADAFFASGPTNSSNLKLSGNVNLGNVSQRLIAATSTTSIVEMTGVVSGAAAFSKVGAGILKLTNTGNNYSGGTNLYQGTLLLQADNILPAGPVNFAGGVYGVWDTSYTTNRDFTLSGTAPIFGIAGTTVTTPTGTPSLPIGGAFDVGAVQVFTQSASSVISGVGSLIKTGAGTMVLNGTNTYGPTIASNALQTILTAGVLSISNDANLGNITPLTINGTTVAPGGISFNGGQLLVTDDIITNRTLTMTGTGSINVAAGKTFAVYGTIGDSGNSLAINGPGTVIFNGGAVNGSATNAHNATSINNGGTLMTQATAGTPFGDTAVTINGGTLRINTNGPAATMTLATVTYAAGSYIRLDAMAGFDTQFTATALTRSGQGTLTIIPASSGSMGNTPLSDSRLLTTTVLGQDTRTTAGYSVLTNLNTGSSAGIISPVILRTASPSDPSASFLEYDATLGFITSVGNFPLSNTFAGATTASVVDISAPTAVPSLASVFAVRTSKDISGGTLRIRNMGGFTDVGGLLINGAGGAAPVISANLMFGNTNVASPVMTLAEGIVYVSGGYTSGTATISGRINVLGLTKSGNGTLRLSGIGNDLEGTTTINSGALQIAGISSGPASGTLVLNDTATLDLMGAPAYIGNLGNATGSQGIITNLSAGAGSITLLGTAASIFTGNIHNGSGTTQLIKAGGGTLTMATLTAGNVNAGINTYTGGTTLYTGTINVQNPFGLGGGPMLNGVPVPLGTPGATYSMPGAVKLFGGTLTLQSNGGGPNGNIIFGNPTTLGLNVVINGNTTINVNNVSANAGNSIQISTLLLGNEALNVTGANNYRLKVAGLTTIGGSASVFSPSTGAPVAFELAGQITDGGNGFGLTKAGGGTLIISGTNNIFSGGTSILAGQLQVTGTTGNPLSTGDVIVQPGGMLRLAANSSIGGVASLNVYSSPVAYGVIALDNSFTPSTTLRNAFNSARFGGIMQSAALSYAATIDQASPVDMYFGSTSTTDFVGTILPGSPGALSSSSLYSPSGSTGTYRFSGGTVNLSGANNTLTGSNLLMVGSPARSLTIATVAPAFGTITLNVRNSNNFTFGTIVNHGSTLGVQVGGEPGGSTPLGTGAVEVMNGAVLSYSGTTGSAFNANTLANANNIVLRVGSRVDLDNTTAFTGSGGQGRWGDSAPVTLNGGSLRLLGTANAQTTETVGQVQTFLGTGGLSAVRATGAGAATLTLAGITRTDGGSNTRGSLLLTSSTAFSLGIPAQITATGNTNASTTVAVANTAGLFVGQVIAGSGIPAGTTITAITANTSI
ncbi:MAG: hypothetical protein JWO89_3806, partial [Verrucomicrobiaceae bacterium]|nr:hypothetical protein [Verrucomicrobiaceae bacterium]